MAKKSKTERMMFDRGPIRTTLMDSLLGEIGQHYDIVEDDAGIGLGEWALKNKLVIDRDIFTFDKHEYLIEPYMDTHPDITEQKATQLGLTVKAMLKTFFSCRYRGFKKGVLYLFPSRTDVTEFSKGRIEPLMEDNPETIGSWIRDTDSANIKKIWNAFLYLRGMKSRVGLKSVPCDLVIFDEIDEGPQDMIELALERLAHSEFKESLALSNPTCPDYGISKLFQMTDQKHWLLKCPACGHYNCMEDDFQAAITNKSLPKCLIEIGGRVIRACEKCQSELNPSLGEWVAKAPRITDKRGYQYSQLWSHYVKPEHILSKYKTTDKMQNFVNLKIGLPYIEAENRLSKEEVLALCADYGIASSDRGPCYIGVDQGKDLHVVIGKRESHVHQMLHIGVYKDWTELDGLMRNFRAALCVVDGQPEMRPAREFATRFPGRVFLNFYNHHQRGTYKWNEEDMTVIENRTECLDASHRRIKMGRSGICLPRQNKVIEDFAQHCHNIGKVLEEDMDGNRTYTYKRLGPDHFRHAFNLYVVAAERGQDSLFGDSDLS